MFDDEFFAELSALPEEVRVAVAAKVKLLRDRGPLLGRPDVDTLKGTPRSRWYVEQVRIACARAKRHKI